jgi:hypothetical protein
MLIQAVKDSEDQVHNVGVWASSDIKRVKLIKINPRYMYELQAEEAKLLKGRDLPPYLCDEEQNGVIVPKFFGIPLRIDRGVDRWEAVI